jgi:transposase
MSYGKIAGTFAKFFGISITPGACAQIVLRGGRKLQPVYQQIRQQVRTSQYLTPDETGWRIGGHATWLHAWVGDQGATCFVIDPHRSAEALAQVLGWDWSGTMTHDGWSSYDRFVNAGHQQCLDHLLRRARALLDKQKGAAKAFPQQVLDLVAPTLKVRDEFVAGQRSQADLVQTQERVVAALLDLTQRPRGNALNETFAKHLYHYAEQWFQFLLDPQIPATNHRGEQALRTPIVNRKVWGGNRTEAGGEAQAITGSVLQTCKNKVIDSFAFCSNAFRGVLGNLFAPSIS